MHVPEFCDYPVRKAVEQVQIPGKLENGVSCAGLLAVHEGIFKNFRAYAYVDRVSRAAGGLEKPTQRSGGICAAEDGFYLAPALLYPVYPLKPPCTVILVRLGFQLYYSVGGLAVSAAYLALPGVGVV